MPEIEPAVTDPVTVKFPPIVALLVTDKDPVSAIPEAVKVPFTLKLPAEPVCAE